MTTIAWKGRTLAADTQLTYEDATKAFCRKITFFGDFQVVAVAGDVESEFYFKRWLQAGGKIDSWGNSVIEFLKKPKFEALYVDKRKQVWYYTDGPAPMLIEHKFAAIGSGRSLALAAMHMGLNAKDAVLLAGDIDINTNKIVDTYDLQTGKLTLRKPPSAVVQAPKEG
jgi:ATP-dependent protease HslVU (ClpYQ) peptidase subunit